MSSSTCCAGSVRTCARCARRSIPKAAPTASTTTIPITAMAPCMPNVMADALYRLLAWLSPAYPIGGFSYSHGIQDAGEEGFFINRAWLVAWLQTVLGAGNGRVDGALFAAAWRAAHAQDWQIFD